MIQIRNISSRWCLLLLCQPILWVTAIAQQVTVKAKNADVRIFPSPNSQHEVHISINKTLPTNLIVSANTSLSQGNYVSNDGGVTWTGSDRMPNNQAAAGDPSTSFDASGRGYIATMIPSGNTADGYSVQFTDNQGSTWSNSIRGSGPKTGFDKEMITTVDEMQTSPFANNFYCAWTDFGDASTRVFFNRSTNRSSTFSTAIPLSTTAGQGTNVQTGPNGEVYVCWADYGATGRLPAGSIGFASSFDGGVTFNSINPFTYSGIRTVNVGNTNFGGTRVNDYPTMAVDKSCGPNRGRIYITYPEFIQGSTQSAIRIRFSDDRGLTWSNIRTLSDPNNRQSWFPWIAVDDLTGLVSVVYYSFDQGTSNTTNTFLSFSSDGILWQRIRVSDQGHITAPIPNFSGGYAGDYIGVAAFDGVTYAAWADDRTGIWQIFVAKVEFNSSSTISSQTDLVINQPSVIAGNQKYQATNNIKVANLRNVTTDRQSHVELVAGKEIMFHPGFSVAFQLTPIIAPPQGDFIARIDNVTPCTTPGAVFLRKKPIEWQTEDNILKETQKEVQIFAYPNPATDYITVGCVNNQFKEVHFSLSEVNGGKIYENQLPDVISNESIRKVFKVSHLAAGTYIVTMNVDNQIFSTKIIKQ